MPYLNVNAQELALHPRDADVDLDWDPLCGVGVDYHQLRPHVWTDEPDELRAQHEQHEHHTADRDDGSRGRGLGQVLRHLTVNVHSFNVKRHSDLFFLK